MNLKKSNTRPLLHIKNHERAFDHVLSSLRVVAWFFNFNPRQLLQKKSNKCAHFKLRSSIAGRFILFTVPFTVYDRGTSTGIDVDSSVPVVHGKYSAIVVRESLIDPDDDDYEFAYARLIFSKTVISFIFHHRRYHRYRERWWRLHQRQG